MILVNPYPIFPKHLTLPARKHTPQSIEKRFADLLTAAEALPNSVLFYNGPHSCASASDHAHFQAAEKGSLPLEKEWAEVERRPLRKRDGVTLSYLNRTLNPALRLDAASIESATELFDEISPSTKIHPGNSEPRIT